jgi:hypothetical protein
VRAHLAYGATRRRKAEWALRGGAGTHEKLTQAFAPHCMRRISRFLIVLTV